MRWRIPLIAALLAFAAVGCDQQPAEPVPDQVVEAPALNFMNGPENPAGFALGRSETPLGLRRHQESAGKGGVGP